jgi:ferredoxin
MKIVVDRDLCESNGLCVDACSDVFRLDDEDRLVVVIERPGDALRAQVEHAVRICPRQALSIEEHDS